MAQVCFRVDLVNEAVAVGLQWGEVVGPFLVAHVHYAVGGEEHAVASVACGHHTVHHVDATVDGFEDIGRCADSHEVTGFVGWQDFVDHLNHLIHGFGRFADSQPSDGVAVGAEFSHSRGGFTSQVGIGASLHNREEALPVAVEPFGCVEMIPATF